MLLRILGSIELVVAVTLGLKLLYGITLVDAINMSMAFIFLRGIIFTVASKDIASMVDLVFGIYAILALNGIFSHYTITIAMIVWFSQKALFSLLV